MIGEHFMIFFCIDFTLYFLLLFTRLMIMSAHDLMFQVSSADSLLYEQGELLIPPEASVYKDVYSDPVLSQT